MTPRRQAVLAFTWRQEGGYQCRRGDAGNWTGGRIGWGTLIGTNRGISAPVLLASRRRAANSHTLAITPADMQDVSQAESAAIYAAEFMDPLRFDALPLGIGEMLFDCSVQSGQPHVVEIAQRVVGGLVVDGDLGDRTLAALGRQLAGVFLHAMSDAFLAHLANGPQWHACHTDFTRRADERLATCLALAQPAGPTA